MRRSNAFPTVLFKDVATARSTLGGSQTQLCVTVAVDVVRLYTVLLCNTLRLIASQVEERVLVVARVDVVLHVKMTIKIRLLCAALACGGVRVSRRVAAGTGRRSHASAAGVVRENVPALLGAPIERNAELVVLIVPECDSRLSCALFI